MVNAPVHVQQPGKVALGLMNKQTKGKNLLHLLLSKESMKQIHQNKVVYAHQTNQPVSIKDKVMFCCLRITYKGMHTPNLHETSSKY